MADLTETLTVAQRIARIEAACATPLGFAMRGVSSWDQEWLSKRRAEESLPFLQEARLREIETQVFGYG